MRYVVFLVLACFYPLGHAWPTCIGLGCACTVSALGVAFGNYFPTSGVPGTSTGSVTVRCQGLVPVIVGFSVSLSRGNSSTFNPRYMLNGSNQLTYNLYTTNGYTTVWGDGTGGTVTQSATYLVPLAGTNDIFVTYGRVPGSQNVPAGSYADTIVVTVTY